MNNNNKKREKYLERRRCVLDADKLRPREEWKFTICARF